MHHPPASMKCPPVFIVGAPRSGTTMLAAMIGSHSDFAIGPESQFFSKLPPLNLQDAVSDPQWPKLAVELICSLSLAQQSVAELYETDSSQIADVLESQRPSVQAMLEALTVPFAVKRGRQRWAEKTPNHLLNLPEIRRLWPESKIIRIMRDPRDSALSTCRLPTFSNSFVANLYLWRKWQDVAEPFLSEDVNSITIRYESLVSEPETELRAICKFLDISYEFGMMDFSKAAKDVSSSAEVWKKPVSGGLTKDRIFAWKNTLNTEFQALANNVTYEYLQKFDYDRVRPPNQTRRVFRLSRRFIENHQAMLIRLSNRQQRWLPTQNSADADFIVDQPEYRKFRHPQLIGRFLWGRIYCAIGEIYAKRLKKTA